MSENSWGWIKKMINCLWNYIWLQGRRVLAPKLPKMFCNNDVIQFEDEIVKSGGIYFTAIPKI